MVHLESIVQPQHRAGSEEPDPVQIAGNQVGLIQPAAKHVIGLVANTGEEFKVL